ncbi:hypothetical protein EA462_05155 [Natrarchaeobius halalkaliphilus]|uniref:Uncharacterized protein n=1 Tax=Natrarchaeobius halalkaliphilus TaxID=1679091 RepID=A0A3N6P6G0_9EURY|nr:hypothetical protein [Natrarchaeobius halalkaliphilus]RQG91365.1 hypothetical protein EA462_05155 [Natrarchaeobius halalkaliphilus]
MLPNTSRLEESDRSGSKAWESVSNRDGSDSTGDGEQTQIDGHDEWIGIEPPGRLLVPLAGFDA